MGDYIVFDSKDQYKRGREGGHASNTIEIPEHAVWDYVDQFSKKHREILKCVDCILTKNEKEFFSMDILNLIYKIESNNQKLNRFALILVMKFCVEMHTKTFERYGKEQLNIFLKEKWKEINSVLGFNSKNVEQKLKEKSMLLHLQIYKTNILPESESVSRYAALWEENIYMYNYKKIQEKNNNREQQFSKLTEVKDIENYEISQRNYLPQILNIKANNGTNACYINTVLFLWSCHPTLKKLMMYNKYFDQQTKHEIESLINEKWDDKLYKKFFQLFKQQELMDIPNIYGELSHPHTIINFMSESIFKTSGVDFEVDMDSIYNLTTFEKFLDVFKNNQHRQLLGIIKTVEQIPIALPINDIRRDQCGFHYVSFYMLRPDLYILFDALKGGVVSGTFTNKEVFTFCNPERISCEKGEASFTFFFIWLENKKRKKD